MKKILLVALAAIALAGCQSSSQRDRALVGGGEAREVVKVGLEVVHRGGDLEPVLGQQVQALKVQLFPCIPAWDRAE